MKLLQSIFRTFPTAVSGDFDPNPIRSLLRKGLGVTRAAFLLPSGKGLEASGETAVRASTALYRRLVLEGKAWIAGSGSGNRGKDRGWSGFWPVRVGEKCRGCWALGFGKNGSRPGGETPELMDLLARRTGLFLHGQGLYRELEEARRLSQAGALSILLMHEIRNHLTPLSTLAQLLPRKWEDARFRTEFSGGFSRAVERISDLSEGVLDFSKAPGKATVPLEWGTVLGKVDRLLSPLFRARRVRLDIQSGPGLWMRAQEGQILSLAVNLVQNALQASPSDSRVWVRAGKTGGKTPGIRFSVEDEGKGLSPEKIPRLFDAFFTDRETGTGLGLFLCKIIVENHGGALTAGNRSPRGAVFTAQFPLAGDG